MSYEEEHKILCDWMRQRTVEYCKATDEERKKKNEEGTAGLDSELDVIRKRDVAEYNRRLFELKKSME